MLIRVGEELLGVEVSESRRAANIRIGGLQVDF